MAEADYWIARGDAAAAERVIGAADPAGPYGCVLLARLVELLLDHGRATDAAAALDRLTEVAGGRFAPWSRVSLLRATGLVRGDPDALRAAVAEARAAELELEWARGVPLAGDADELVVAYQAFAGMGADGLRRSAGRRLRELGAKVPRARTRSAGLLTESEERIARLVRQGMRNREIAAALHYTPRSVEVYLSRIYAKLRISSRLELARLLDTTDRAGLASEHPTTGRCAVSTVDLPGSVRTVAQSVFVTAAADPERTALRYKVDGEWRDESFGTLAGTVRALAGGFAASGIQPGDRVCILADTRPEWTYVSLALLAAGAVVVPIYPSSSVEDCTWIISDSGAGTVFCDTPAQREKALAAGAGTVLDIDSLAGLAVLDQSTVDDRLAAIRPDDLAVIIYTSGTTGPPKGCMLTHQNWLTVVNVNDELDYVTRDDVVYLFLPLAHVFAQMLQFACMGSGATLAYFGGDIKRVVPELAEVQPTFLPSVPRIFEKLYTAMTASLDPAAVRDAVAVGWEYRRLSRAGQPIPADLAVAFERLEPLFAHVRAAFGGRVRQALSGAAPIAREVLEFFFAAGVPVLEGYGMTETTGLGTVSTLSHFKLGSVGRPGPGVTMKVDPDGELLARGPHLFAGYWHNDAATESTVDSEGWLHTGDLATIDEDGYVTITGRKKDIIITAGGKNIAPANFENELRQSPWISYVIMIGDRRPYPVALFTLDEDEILRYANENSLPADIPTLSTHPDIVALIQSVLDSVNAQHSAATQIKRFAILPRDLSIIHNELTPSLKVKRPIVHANHAAVIEILYS